MIINLTQHAATPEQVESGVVDLEGDNLKLLQKYLTFETIDDTRPGTMQFRARFIAHMAYRTGAKKAMIGGAFYFQGPLSRALLNKGIVPMWAYTERKVYEEAQPDGSVRKFGIFKHLGFVRDLHMEEAYTRNVTATG